MEQADTRGKTCSGVRPFLKWVGGKRGLLSELAPLLPRGVERMRLVEPFAGGAALFFGAVTTSAHLSDINHVLMGTYRAVQQDVEGVIAHLLELAKKHSRASYYGTRQRFNAGHFACSAEAAAAFIYLNRTCYNGLYRVNRRGEFNVPMGSYASPRIVDVEGLRAASARLQAAELGVGGFEHVLERVRPGDFVYLDPPYVPRSATSNFASYAPDGFGDQDQARLRDVFAELARRGVHTMLSNSDTPRVRALYRRWSVRRVRARRSVGCLASSRAGVHEVVIRSYA